MRKRPTAESIVITGAREHNLKNLSLSIPRNQFVVVTGVSGSGKSTLAFDLIFAEGQRRFLDCMNVYARQFVEQLPRPDVDQISGIPPTVSIEQRNSRGGGKSTVATVTEVYHFIRLLFARLGTQFCPKCDVPVEAQTKDSIVSRLTLETKKRGPLLLLAPAVRNRKGFHTDVGEWAAKHGYGQVRADGILYPTTERLRLDRFSEHDVEIVVGTLKRTGVQAAESIKTPQQLIDEALKLGGGVLFAESADDQVSIHSTHRACPQCGDSFAQIDPKNFSYNSAQGWCPRCRGFGELFYLPEDVDRGARADAIEESWFGWQEGKREICPECHGARLNPVARAVRLVAGNSRSRQGQTKPAPSIVDIGNASVDESLAFFSKLHLGGREGEIARDILPEIRERLKFLCEVGLDYLQLGRAATTLSGGEAQRIRLAAQLGSNLSGVLYVLDEPTIGLHARDNEQLLSALALLKARGNSLLVVEHDEETMRQADYIVDLGPGAGINGGTVVAAGTLKQLLKNPASITGRCLATHKTYPTRGERRAVTATSSKPDGVLQRALGKLKKKDAPPEVEWMHLEHAAVHNLKNVSVAFPLNRFVTVTGVSGSGKSTLIRECLLPALHSKLKGAKSSGAQISGIKGLAGVHEVDQSPIGRTPRSIPATYVGFFDQIRELFAQTPEARLRGYSASRFSFNSAQGRCPQCDGAGVVKLEMSFLPTSFVRCETCEGCRFNPETLDIQFNGKNIAQVLELSVGEAIEFFAAQRRILLPLQALRDTGLDYIKLGQPSPTLSGGEAQRIKLVTHLLGGLRQAVQKEMFKDMDAKHARRVKSSLFILEEPTIGLHMADVQRLVEVIQRLVDAGHSVIVIEHNLDLIAESDWVIDLGPEGGDGGGEIVAQGPPEEIARSRHSHTGRFLRPVLKGSFLH